MANDVQIRIGLQNAVTPELRKLVAEGQKTGAAFKQMFGAFTAADLAADAIRNLVAEFKNLVTYSARTEELSIVVQNIGKQAGYSADTVNYYVDAVKKMGNTKEDATRAGTKLIQNDLDLAKATDMARMAQDAATIAGIDSSEALGRMIPGIVTLQPEVLKQMGIMVSLENEYAKFAKTNGRTTTSLTSFEKQQIALNAVLNQSGKIAGNYEAAMGTAGKQVRSFERYIKDIYESLGKLTLPIYTEMVFGLADAFKFAREWLEEHKNELEEWSRRIVQATTDLKYFIIELKNLAGLADPMRNLGSAIKDGLLNQDILDIMKAMYKTLEALAHGFNMFWYGSQMNFKRAREEWALAKKAWMGADALTSKVLLIPPPPGTAAPQKAGQTPPTDAVALAAAEAARKQKELADKAAKDRLDGDAKAAAKAYEEAIKLSEQAADAERKRWEESAKAGKDYNAAIFEATATQYEKDLRAADEWLQAQRDRLNDAAIGHDEYQTKLTAAEAAADDMRGVAHYEEMDRQIEAAREQHKKSEDDKETITNQTYDRMKASMSDFLYAGIAGELESFKGIWAALWKSLARIAANALAEDLFGYVKKELKNLSGGGGGGISLGDIFSGISGLLGFDGGTPGVGGTIIVHEGGYIPRFHFGGLSSDEIPAILQRGEYVVSRRGG